MPLYVVFNSSAYVYLRRRALHNYRSKGKPATEAEDRYRTSADLVFAPTSAFKVKTRAGKGGKITRSKTVTYGKSVLIKIKTNKKYKISKLYIDGKRVKKRKKIKFKNISANHSVRVYFSRRK